MQLLSPQLQIGNLRQKTFGQRKKVVALPPDGSFPEQIGCRAGRPQYQGDSSNRIVRRVQTAVQKHQPECALRGDRRELGIIFRNSGSCKALCFAQRQTTKGNTAWYLSFPAGRPFKTAEGKRFLLRFPGIPMTSGSVSSAAET